MATIGDRIRRERERLGMTQPQFAVALGLSKGTISQWETGITTPKGTNLMALVKVTGRSAGWFISGEDDSELVPTDDKQRLDDAYEQMTPAQRRTLGRMAEAMLEEANKPD